MTVNQRVFDTTIVSKTESNRCIGPSESVAANAQFLVTADNDLKCVIATTRDDAEMRSSSDNGFTWSTRDNAEDMRTSIKTTNIYDGPYMTLTPMRDWNSDDTVYRDNWVYVYSAGDSIWYQGERTAAAVTIWGNITSKFGTGSDEFGNEVGSALDGGFFASTGHGEEIFYSAFTTISGSLLTMIGQNFNNSNITQVLQEYVEYSIPVVSGVIAVKSDQDLVHTVAVLALPSDSMRYIPYTKAFGSHYSIAATDNGSFGGAVEMIDAGGPAGSSSYREPAIDVDGLGNICVNYYRVDAGNVGSGYYTISNDAGAT